MKEKKDILFRNQLALASLFFFWPLTQWLIKRNSFNLDDTDRKFIKWYIKIWNLSLILLLIYIFTIIAKFYFRENILITVSQVVILILLLVMILWVVWIFSNINIDEKLYINESKIDKTNLFLSYLPLVNIYTRYKNHNFDKPDFINKESIILRSLLFIALPIGNVFLNTILILIIVSRFISLIMGIDILPQDTRNKINKLFYTNPEEIRWYVSASIKHFFKKDPKKDLNQAIVEEKDEYKKLYHTKEITHIKIQYSILILLLLALIYFNLDKINILIFSLFIIWRYLIMQVKRSHLPSIPIIKEVVFWFIKIFSPFISKNKNK